jgi:hypothetical protein
MDDDGVGGRLNEGKIGRISPIMAINMLSNKIGTKIMKIMKTVFAKFGYETSLSWAYCG